MNAHCSPCVRCKMYPQNCKCISPVFSKISTILKNVSRLKGRKTRPQESTKDHPSGNDNGENKKSDEEESVEPKLMELLNQILEKKLQETNEYYQEEHHRVYSEVNSIQNSDISLHDRIIRKRGMPVYVKAVAIMKLKNAGPENSLEYANTIKWLENLLKIPFGKYVEFKYDTSKGIMHFCKEKIEWFDKEIYGM